MELTDLRTLLDDQSGIVSRRQLVAAGAMPHDVRRWLRTRQLMPAFAGVYVNHTGPLTWSSRAWAAVHRYWPAALAMQSAVNLAGDLIHVAVAESRSSTTSETGIRVHRLRDFEDRVQWNRSPPRQRFEDAVISVAAGGSRQQAVDLLTDACRSRLRRELEQRSNTKHRGWLLAVVQDAAAGVRSVLESTYVRRVERAHGLPRSERQVLEVTSQGVVYRDVLYRGWGLVVELDGRMGHESSADRAADLTRDLESAAGHWLTVRVGWHQAELDPCATAASVAQILRARGWTGQPRRCGRCPAPGVVLCGAVS